MDPPTERPSEPNDEPRSAGPAHGTDAGAEEVDERVRRLENQLRYALADLDNLRKRYAREIARERAAERERAAQLWLPVLDHLDLALSHLDGESAVSAGIEAIRAAALDAIAQLGFPRYDDIGAVFDPERHEAVSTVPAPDAPNTIVAALRPGYGADVVLRPASVIVGQGTTGD
jgi:molecular chaperone GrpE